MPFESGIGLCGGAVSIGLMVLAAIAAGAVVAGTLKSRSHLGTVRLGAASGVRIMAVLAVLLALDRGLCNYPDNQSATIALDRSESVQLATQFAASQWAGQLAGQGLADTSFGFGRQGTNLGAAIGGGSAIAGNRELYLASDGAHNLGDWEAGLVAAEASGTRINIAPAERLGEADSAVVSVSHRRQVAAGRKFLLSVGVWAPNARSAEVRIWIGNQLAAGGTVELEPGLSEFSANLVAPLQPVPIPVTVELHDQRSTQTQNDVLSSVLEVYEAAPVLLVGSAPALLNAFSQIGQAVQTTAPEQLPRAASGLAGYSAVVLSDISADALDRAQIAALDAAVADGGLGLAVLGGPNAFAAGGYARSPLNSLLPLDSDPWREQESAQIALLLLVDRSTSMALGGESNSKLALAREAAIAALDLLENGDQLSVVAFNAEPVSIVAPTTLEADTDRAALTDQIAALVADGTTDLFRALDYARRQLADQPAQIRHIILITDGQAHYGRFGALVRAARNDGISISTIAVGADADLELLSSLATNAGGRHYVAADSGRIPAILTQEALLAKNFVTVSNPMQPRLLAPSALFALIEPGAALPWLQGYVRTRARPQAQVVLAANDGDPILAHWLYGQGSVVAWASDLSGVWSAEWTAWDQFPAFSESLLAQLVRGPPPGHSFQIAAHAGTAQITLQTGDGDSFGPSTKLSLELAGPDGSRQVDLTAQAPGVYRGTAAIGPGAWAYRLSDGDTDRGSGILAIPYRAELRPDPAGAARLERAAHLSGGRNVGRINTPGSRIFNDGADWLALAILLLAGDTIVRRLRVGPRVAARQLRAQLRSILGALRPRTLGPIR